MLIGDKIRKAREDKGLKPEYLAGLLDICERTYKDIELNKRRVGLEEADILGKELGFTPEELLYGEPRLSFVNCNPALGLVGPNHGAIIQSNPEEIIASFQAQIATLQAHITALEKMILDKDKIIAMLEGAPGAIK